MDQSQRDRHQRRPGSPGHHGRRAGRGRDGDSVAGARLAVTFLAPEPWLLPRMEPFAGEMVALGLEEAGADVRTGVTVTELRRPGGIGPATLLLDDGTELEADEVLVAIGREPRTGDIGLETVGLIRDRGWT